MKIFGKIMLEVDTISCYPSSIKRSSA